MFATDGGAHELLAAHQDSPSSVLVNPIKTTELAFSLAMNLLLTLKC